MMKPEMFTSTLLNGRCCISTSTAYVAAPPPTHPHLMLDYAHREQKYILKTDHTVVAVRVVAASTHVATCKVE